MTVEARLAELRTRRAAVLAQHSPDRLNGSRPGDVRNVLAIVSASRSGSSFLHHLLARHPDVVSLNGEGGTFARLHGLGRARSAEDSDFLPPGDAAASGVAPSIAEDMLSDAGVLARDAGEDGLLRENFLADCVRRLIVQYPEVDADPDALLRVCADALGARSPRDPEFPAADYWRSVIEALGRGLLPARLSHYDLRGGDLATAVPERGGAEPPPFAGLCVEEPPFVVPRPRLLPAPDELASKTLLLKSSSDCYRLWLLRRLFPNARFRFVVLARNPAAAISGLVDGWLSDGFYSHDLGGVAPLELAGYSRADRPWTTRWWKFDLPPGWSAFRTRPVEEACGLQWLGANEHIRDGAQSGLLDERLDVRYESLLEPAALARELRRIYAFSGLAPSALERAEASRPIMSVTPPAPRKWRKRRGAVAALVSGGAIGAMARELGYDVEKWEDWP